MPVLLQTSRGSFAVDDRGTGDPLVLLHGFPLDHTMWRHQIERFATSNRVVAIDLRGFGKSPATSGTVTMSDFADDVAAVIEALGLKKVRLCGLSMGGYIAFAFVERHRELLDRLILCDTRAVADTPEAAKARRVAAERVLKDGPAFLADSMLPRLFAEKTALSQPDLVAVTRAVMEAANREGVAAAARGMAERPDRTSQLPKIDVPTLVIVGEHDAISPADEMTAIAHAIPGSVLKIIPEAGHMTPLESPAVVNTAIEDFLA